MTEAIEFQNFIEIHTIHVQLRLRDCFFFYLTKRCTSCFKHQYRFEIDTLPVRVQGVMFLKNFERTSYSLLFNLPKF